MQKLKCMSCGGSMYAEGGFVSEEEASGFLPNPMEHEGHMAPHEIPNQSHDGDEMLELDEFMRGKAKGYSKGGKVSNDVGEGQDVDREPNQFDDLVKDDDLEFHDTAANSGDEIGNAEHEKEEDEELDDIMRSRKKKDRLPRPA